MHDNPQLHYVRALLLLWLARHIRSSLRWLITCFKLEAHQSGITVVALNPGFPFRWDFVSQHWRKSNFAPKLQDKIRKWKTWVQGYITTVSSHPDYRMRLQWLFKEATILPTCRICTGPAQLPPPPAFPYWKWRKAGQGWERGYFYPLLAWLHGSETRSIYSPFTLNRMMWLTDVVLMFGDICWIK